MSLALTDFSEFIFEQGLMDISLVEISCGLITEIPQMPKKKKKVTSVIKRSLHHGT